MTGRSDPPDRNMLRRALFLLTVCGILAFIVLAVRLFQLQVLRHEELSSAALEQQLRKTDVTADRGTIFDRNGRVLAMSATTYTIYLSPAEISMYGEDASLIAREMSPVLDVPEEKLLSLADDRSSWYKTVARKVSRETADRLREIKNTYGIESIKIEPDTKRYYPDSSLASHLIGFVGMENTGLSGVEYALNDTLTGTNGSIRRLKNSAGTDMLFTGYEEYLDPVSGSSVYLTVDANMQYCLEKNLAQAVEDYDIQNGAAGIIMDPQTGEILAMASLGNFDLNDYQTVSEDVQREIDAAPDEAAASAIRRDAQQRMWRNKAISDTYEPGSTFKIITLAMALEENVADMQSSFYCGGSMSVQGRGVPLHCWKTAGHGSQTLTEAVQHSCNVAFATLGLRIGEETFYRYCEDFGFFNASDDPQAGLTGRTGIDLPGESGSIWWSRDVFCDPENLSQLAAASFGQTFNITPLQLITAVSACCNGGELLKPAVVKKVVAPDGTVTEEHQKEVVRQVISRETSDTVNTILERVVGDTVQGTGKNAYVAGYRIAGKTGTSEKVAQDVSGGAKEYIVSFIGYAPAEDPQVICLILLDTPSPETGIYISGGQMAAPVVGHILGELLPYMGVKPSYTQQEKQYLDREIPDVTGLTTAEAEKKLRDAGLSFRLVGEGENVAVQLPGAGTTVAGGSSVLLYTEVRAMGVAVVPELLGCSYGEARHILEERGLFLRSDSTVLADSDVVHVVFQNMTPGTEACTGTVVTVSLVNEDDETYGKY